MTPDQKSLLEKALDEAYRWGRENGEATDICDMELAKAEFAALKRETLAACEAGRPATLRHWLCTQCGTQWNASELLPCPKCGPNGITAELQCPLGEHPTQQPEAGVDGWNSPGVQALVYAAPSAAEIQTAFTQYFMLHDGRPPSPSAVWEAAIEWYRKNSRP